MLGFFVESFSDDEIEEDALKTFPSVRRKPVPSTVQEVQNPLVSPVPAIHRIGESIRRRPVPSTSSFDSIATAQSRREPAFGLALPAAASDALDIDVHKFRAYSPSPVRDAWAS